MLFRTFDRRRKEEGEVLFKRGEEVTLAVVKAGREGKSCRSWQGSRIRKRRGCTLYSGVGLGGGEGGFGGGEVEVDF